MNEKTEGELRHILSSDCLRITYFPSRKIYEFSVKVDKNSWYGVEIGAEDIKDIFNFIAKHSKLQTPTLENMFDKFRICDKPWPMNTHPGQPWILVRDPNDPVPDVRFARPMCEKCEDTGTYGCPHHGHAMRCDCNANKT